MEELFLNRKKLFSKKVIDIYKIIASLISFCYGEKIEKKKKLS